jgi:alpha-galactosidase
MKRIEFDSTEGVYLLQAGTTSYAFRRDEGDVLLHLYWGARINLADAVQLVGLSGHREHVGFEGPWAGREELPVRGGLRYGQPSFAARFADGVSGVEWVASAPTVEEKEGHAELVVPFSDPTYALWIELHYRVHDETDVLDRWVVVRNDGDEPVDVDTAFSAAWTAPLLGDYRLSHLHGRSLGETQLNKVRLPPGELVVGSRQGVTGHAANPWFALDDGTAGEEYGEVWTGALAWSGSWRLVATRFSNGRVQVAGGFDHNGERLWRLMPGETLTTPTFSGLYSAAGFGHASREWHTYQLRNVLPDGERERPILYNSWEVTHFDVDETNQRELAKIAAGLGVELFVVDDGWFGGRRHSRAGLGDWFPSPERFPQGLGPLIDEVHELGMKFGLWVEPEMVNPDSALYRANPDWVYHFPTRRRSERRNQLVLNLARSDVARWVYDTLDGLLTENEIDYIKWDMNRPISDPGWPAERNRPERVWIDHVHNLYDILDRIRRAHPDVAFESCSAGGGRVDLGILRRTDMVWTSDNTDALDRLAIQHGFTQLYAPRVMSAWVTDSPNFLNGRRYSLKFRFHTAMAGLLGIGANILTWSDQERSEATQLIETYKRIRPIVQHGLLYRLRPPGADDLSAAQYLARDHSAVVVIAWLHSQRFGRAKPPLRLLGLDPTATYRDVDTGEEWSGALLSQHGLLLDLRGDFDSQLVHLERA